MLRGPEDLQPNAWRFNSLSTAPSPRSNRLLASLPTRSYSEIRPHLELVKLARGDMIHARRGSHQSIYFLIEGIVSVLELMRDGRSIEVAIIGREGLVGASALLGCHDAASHVEVQAKGAAYRLNCETLRRAFARCDQTQQILLRYTHSLFRQTAQTAVCGRHHSVTQQLIRRLLLGIDRSLCLSLAMTHESMACKLGVRRESVTVAAQKLQAQKLISYRRGYVTVLDRARLESMCCECYERPGAQQPFLDPAPRVAREFAAVN